MLGYLRSRARGAYKRYDRVFTQAKELAWKTGDLAWTRRRVAVGHALSAKAALRIAKEKGYLQFAATAFGGTEKLVAVGRDIYARWSAQPRDSAEAVKSYFHNIMTPEDLRQNPASMDFAMNRQLLSTLSGYFGLVPEFCSVGLMLSIPAEKLVGSQHGHFDASDSNHVKVIVPVEDVGEENGPFEFIPADASLLVREKARHLHSFGGRYKDNSLFKIVPRSTFISATFKAAEGLIVDTSNCLHFGSRVQRGHRLMWFIHFANFSEYRKIESTPNGSILVAQLADRARYASDEATRLALNVRTH
jgi:hypothetical protein